MLILVPCPECGLPAEVTDRFALASTDGPIDHLALCCAAQHHLRMPVGMLPAQSQDLLWQQETAPTQPGCAHTVPGGVNGLAISIPSPGDRPAGPEQPGRPPDQLATPKGGSPPATGQHHRQGREDRQ